VVLLAFGLLLVAGCGRTNDKRAEIVFWAMGAEGEHVQKLMPEFERRSPDVKVRVQMIPWNAAHEKLLTAYAGHSLPDLCQLGNTWIPEFQILDAIENLSPRLAQSRSLHDTSYFPGIWDTNVIDSLLYGLPWYVDTRVLFYRSDLLAEVGYPDGPKTWDEWFDASAKLKRLHPSNYAVFFSTNNEWAPQVIMGLQNGALLLKERGTYADFSAPQFRTALKAFHEFFTNGWAPVKTMQIANIYQSFSEGYFAMHITGPWNIGEFSRRLPPGLQSKWMTAPLPGPEGGFGKSLAGGSSLVMFKTSEKKAEVWKLIEYLSEPDVQIKFYGLTGDLPARTEAWKDSVLAKNKYAAAFFRQLNQVVPTPKIPEWEQIAQQVRQVTELVSMDKLTIDEATAELDRTVNIMLEKRRWMVTHAK
jgi:multiple sugar transport system substrate-binding protein